MPPLPARLRFQTALRSGSESASDLGTSLSFSPGSAACRRWTAVVYEPSGPQKTALRCAITALVSGLLLAVLKAVKGLLNHVTTALYALSWESHHPLHHRSVSKIPLNIEASTGCIYWTTESKSVKGARASSEDLQPLVNTANPMAMNWMPR
jgi:hypothetical protein